MPYTTLSPEKYAVAEHTTETSHKIGSCEATGLTKSTGYLYRNLLKFDCTPIMLTWAMDLCCARYGILINLLQKRRLERNEAGLSNTAMKQKLETAPVKDHSNTQTN
jgi:hypothetical protein